MISSFFVLRHPLTGSLAVFAIAFCGAFFLLACGVTTCDAQQSPTVKRMVVVTQQQLPKPASTQATKPSSESVVKPSTQPAQSPVVRVTPKMVSPMNSMQSSMMGGMPQRADDRQFRTRIEPGTRDEIRERHGEQIKRHELCRRLEQRRQELLLERREHEQKGTK